MSSLSSPSLARPVESHLPPWLFGSKHVEKSTLAILDFLRILYSRRPRPPDDEKVGLIPSRRQTRGGREQHSVTQRYACLPCPAPRGRRCPRPGPVRGGRESRERLRSPRTVPPLPGVSLFLGRSFAQFRLSGNNPRRTRVAEGRSLRHLPPKSREFHLRSIAADASVIPVSLATLAGEPTPSSFRCRDLDSGDEGRERADFGNETQSADERTGVPRGQTTFRDSLAEDGRPQKEIGGSCFRNHGQDPLLSRNRDRWHRPRDKAVEGLSKGSEGLRGRRARREGEHLERGEGSASRCER